METTSVILHILAPLSLIYAVRMGMAKTNLIGFVTICLLNFFTTVHSHISHENLETFHSITLILFIMWILCYNTYKKYHKARDKNDRDNIQFT